MDDVPGLITFRTDNFNEKESGSMQSQSERFHRLKIIWSAAVRWRSYWIGLTTQAEEKLVCWSSSPQNRHPYNVDLRPLINHSNCSHLHHFEAFFTRLRTANVVWYLSTPFKATIFCRFSDYFLLFER